MSLTQPFKKGDVVILKTDGRTMYVKGESTQPDEVFCEWIDSEGRRQAHSFPAGVLTTKPEPKPVGNK